MRRGRRRVTATHPRSARVSPSWQRLSRSAVGSASEQVYSVPDKLSELAKPLRCNIPRHRFVLVIDVLLIVIDRALNVINTE